MPPAPKLFAIGILGWLGFFCFFELSSQPTDFHTTYTEKVSDLKGYRLFSLKLQNESFEDRSYRSRLIFEGQARISCTVFAEVARKATKEISFYCQAPPKIGFKVSAEKIYPFHL